jgi:hypothetical protein
VGARKDVRNSWLIVAAALFLASCESGSPPPSPRASSPGPEVVASGTCTNAPEVAADKSLAGGELLTADVDGDGSSDQVAVHLDEDGPPGCTAFLVVTTETQVLSAPVWELGRQGGLPAPRLKLAAEINARPGLEVAVDEVAGASTQFLGLFTIHDHRLQRIEPRRPLRTGGFASLAGGLFGYGGSVGHIEAIDCGQPGHLLLSLGVPAEGGRNAYAITRLDLLVEGATLRPTSRRRERVRLVDLRQSFPEFANSPLGSCARHQSE